MTEKEYGAQARRHPPRAQLPHNLPRHARFRCRGNGHCLDEGRVPLRVVPDGAR
jgi:hypothetical protein